MIELTETINKYNISPSVQKIINIINEGGADIKDASTASYYGMRLINEISRLNDMLFYYPVSIQFKIQEKIEYLEDKVKLLQGIIKDMVGDGPVYFSDLSTNDAVKNHPFVRILTGFKNKGFSLDNAIRLTASVVGAPEISIKSYLEKNDVQYPRICSDTKEYVKGQEDAKELSTKLGRVSSVANRMYDLQMIYKNDNNDFDINSYLAGFCNIYSFSDNELRELNDLSYVLAYTNTNKKR